MNHGTTKREEGTKGGQAKEGGPQGPEAAETEGREEGQSAEGPRKASASKAPRACASSDAAVSAPDRAGTFPGRLDPSRNSAGDVLNGLPDASRSICADAILAAPARRFEPRVILSDRPK